MTSLAADHRKRLETLERRQAQLDKQRARLDFLRARATFDADRIRAKEAEDALKGEVYALMEKMAAEQGRPSPGIDARIAELEQDAKRDPRIANGLHLIDLKRAGHSPSRTELRMKVDGQHTQKTVIRPYSMSLFGSTAAMCADEHGQSGRHRYGGRAD